MKVYLATWPPQKQEEQTIGQAWAQEYAMTHEPMKLRVLLSYWYYQDVDLGALFAKYFPHNHPDVFADSGAYSATTVGAQIEVDDYAAWVKRWKHLFVSYSNLDVVGDPDATAENQAALEAQGLAPVPVFHVSARPDYDRLDALCDRYPYVALGGMVPYMRTPQKIMPHLVKCFRIAGKRTVFHGFGCTSWTILRALPWYSVDSSSWGIGFRYGRVPLFDERRGRFREAYLGNRKQWADVAPIVRAFGFDPLDFADRSRNDRAKICAISALSYMRAEQWLRKRHGEIRIPNRDAPVGLRTHLVAGPATTTSAVGGNMSVQALAAAGLEHVGAGARVYLAESTAGPRGGGDIVEMAKVPKNV